MNIEDEIIQRVHSLSPDAQLRLLSYLERFDGAKRTGRSGREMLALCGTVDEVSANEMTAAIEAGCETVDTSEW